MSELLFVFFGVTWMIAAIAAIIGTVTCYRKREKEKEE